MNLQHPNKTFSTPRLSDATERVLASQSPIVKISEIDVTRLKFEMSHTTASGTGTALGYLGVCYYSLSKYATGECDLHISREGVYPSWFGYAMRESAPFIDNINRWFGKTEKLVTIKKLQNFLDRVRRFQQFGLGIKWLEMSKGQYKEWQVTKKNYGIHVMINIRNITCLRLAY